MQLEPSDKVKTRALDLGFTTVGICEADAPTTLDALHNWIQEGFGAEMDYLASPLRSHPNQLLPGAQSVIAVTLNYYQQPRIVPGQPKMARYALGRDYHKVIRSKLKKLEKGLSDEYPNARFRACVDSAPILEREYAQRSGLGWFGKNTCLIDSKRGSWFFIGLLLSTIRFEPDRPALGGCGTCTRCIDACPTGAIKLLNGRWSVDARDCISYLTIEKRGDFTPSEAQKIGEWTFGCDVCQEVCPFNQPSSKSPNRAMKTEEPDFYNQKVWPSLLELANLSEEHFNSLTQGSAVRRARFEGIKRNAKANLGN